MGTTPATPPAPNSYERGADSTSKTVDRIPRARRQIAADVKWLTDDVFALVHGGEQPSSGAVSETD